MIRFPRPAVPDLNAGQTDRPGTCLALADSGKPLALIRTQLVDEGHDRSHLEGAALRKQLSARIAATKQISTDSTGT